MYVWLALQYTSEHLQLYDISSYSQVADNFWRHSTHIMCNMYITIGNYYE